MNRVVKTVLRSIPRSIVVACELLAVLAVILAGAATYGLVRLAQGPVDVSFATGAIEDALSGDGQRVQVDVDRATLHWPDVSGPIVLDLNHLAVKSGGQDVLNARNVSLAVAKWPLLVGRVRPEGLILNQPDLTFVRDAENRVRMAFVPVGQGEGLAPSPAQASAISWIMTFLFSGQSDGFGILGQIENIEIRRARVRIIDERLGMTWRLTQVGATLRSVDVGVLGTMDVVLSNGQSFRSTLRYQRADDVLTITSTFQDFSLPSFAGRLMGAEWLRRQYLPMTGTVKIVAGLKTPRVSTVSIEAQAGQGQLDFGDDIGVRTPIEQATLKVDFDDAKNEWRVPQFDFVASGIPVRTTLNLNPKAPGELRGDFIIQAQNITHADLLALWPVAARDTPLSRWLLQKAARVTFRDVQMVVPVVANLRDRQLTLLALHPTAKWQFKDLDLDYRPPLQPLSKAAGTGTYENDALSINVSDGWIKDLSAAGSTVHINDLAKAGQGHAHLDLTLKGPVKSVIDYISDEPIALGSRLPFDRATVAGQGTYHAVVSFPTLKDLPKDLVEADVTATLSDIRLPKLVKGLDLTGGPFDVSVKDGHAVFKGSGALGGRPATIDWQEPMSRTGQKTLARGTATVDTDASVRSAFGANLDLFEGSMPLSITYTEHPKGLEQIDLTADLTPTRINSKDLQYEKAPGIKADLALSVTLQNGVIKEAKGLKVKAPNLNIQSGTLNFGAINGTIDVTRASLPRVIWGKSDAAVTYTRTAKTMAVDIKGKRFDLGPLLAGKGDSTSGPAFSLSVGVDALGFGGVEDLRAAELKVDIDTATDIDRLAITGTAGDAPVQFNYDPDDQGRMALVVTAANAGAFLRVLDVYDNMKGGTLRLAAAPEGNNNRDVKGKLVIKDFSVIKAPILAQLLGAMSLQGVGEQLGNQGIGFERLQSSFALRRRAGSDVMIFKDGRTSGSALGLTFDGVYDRRAGVVDITGTIIPVSGLNTFASRIPVVGQLLTGGKGSALFAATYAVKGPVEKTETSINPLSVLTPGILRRIFFEGEPDSVEGDTQDSSISDPYN